MIQQSMWDEIGGKVGRDHPEQSHKAAATVKSGTQKAQILLTLYKLWPHKGLTGYEVSSHVFNGAGRPISPNQACTRLLELREKGLVEFDYDRFTGTIIEAPTTPGNTGAVHVLTQLGINKVIELMNS